MAFPTVVVDSVLKADRASQADAVLAKLGDPEQAARQKTADLVINALPPLPEAKAAPSPTPAPAPNPRLDAQGMSGADATVTPSPTAAPEPTTASGVTSTATTEAPTPSPTNVQSSSSTAPNGAAADRVIAGLGPLPSGLDQGAGSGDTGSGQSSGVVSPPSLAVDSPRPVTATPPADTTNLAGGTASSTDRATTADQFLASLPPLPDASSISTAASSQPTSGTAPTAASSVSSPPSVSPSLPQSSSQDAGPSSSASLDGGPTPGDVAGWRRIIQSQSPASVANDPGFLDAVLTGAMAESGLNSQSVQQGGGGRGFFQFDLGGMGAGLSAPQLFSEPYQAAQILPLYAQAWLNAPPGLSPADKAAWVAVQAERPDDRQGQATANYKAAYQKIVGSRGTTPTDLTMGEMRSAPSSDGSQNGDQTNQDAATGPISLSDVSQDGRTPVPPLSVSPSGYNDMAGAVSGFNAPSVGAASNQDVSGGDSRLTPSSTFRAPFVGEAPTPGSTDGGGGNVVPQFGPDPYGGMGRLAPRFGEQPDYGSISDFTRGDAAARLRAVEQGLNAPSQAIRSLVEPDIANGGGETTPQRLARYFAQTDPNATLPKRLEQTLQIADQANDGVVAKVLRDDPSGAVPLGLLTALERTATNPLSYAGMPVEAAPSLVGGGVAGALGAGALAERAGSSPQDVYAATQGGFNVGMGAGPIAETAGRAALAAAPLVGRGAAVVGQGIRDATAPMSEAERNLAAVNAGLDGSGGGVPAGVQRFYHGTGSAFDAPEAAKFDPNGLFGPGYYLTDDARVASSYAENRSNPTINSSAIITQQNLVKTLQEEVAKGGTAYWRDNLARAQAKLDEMMAAPGGSNVRAVNVPQGLKLLDAEQAATPEIAAQIRSILPPDVRPSYDTLSQWKGKPLNNSIGTLIENARGAGANPGAINEGLASLGYDGIRYNGGQRIPLTDENGAPIRHTAVVIFPDSLPKITNAISGRPMGSPPAVGGAVVGGVYGASQPAENDQERARNIVGYGLGGALLGRGLEAAGRGERLPLGGSVEDVTRTGAAGEVPRPGTAEAGTPPTGEAPPTTATPPPLEPDARAGNILLRKYASPDVQQVIADAAAHDPQAMEAARRGVVSDQTVQDLADAVGQNVDKIVKRWKPGNAVNAETITALRTALSTQADKVSQAAQAAQSGSPADLLNLQVALREHAAIQEAVSGTTAEAGRSLRALRANVTSVVQSGDASKMQDLLKRLGGVEWTQELATKLSQLDPTDAVGRYQFLRDAMKPQLKDYLTELWYNAMLSAPRTHLVKSMSETASLLLTLPERAASAAVEAPLAALQGRPRQRFFGEIAPEAFGMAQGIPEGIQKALFTIQHGYRLSDVLNGTDYIRTAAFRGPVGAVINFPSRTMAAAAEFSATVGESGALYSGAYRQARIEGLSGDALIQRVADLRQNPTPSLLKYARDQGQYRVYQQAPGKFVQAIAGLRDAVPLGIGRVLLPFLQTPANLVKFGLERSPLGALNPSIYKNLAKQSPEAADQIGRWAMGSTVAAGIAMLALKGDITGPAPTSPGERDAWTRTGKTPYSIRIGDQWYNYQKLEPLNQTFSQVASLVDAIHQGKNVTDTAGQIAATIGTNLVSQTYMQSLSAAMNALQDPARYGGRFVDSLAGSVVPALVRTVAQNVDPTLRETQGPLEGIQAEIPGQSQNLPPRLNAFGEPIKRDVSNISPVAVSQATTSPIERELARYGVEPGLTGKTLRGMDLTRQEAAEYQQVTGPLVKQRLGNVIAEPGYARLSDLEKVKTLQRNITSARREADDVYLHQLQQRWGKAAIDKRIQQKSLQRVPNSGMGVPVAP